MCVGVTSAIRIFLEEAGSGLKRPFDLTVQEFIDTYWKQYHHRQNTKPGTVYGYLSVLDE
jgi:hypothetical protein